MAGFFLLLRKQQLQQCEAEIRNVMKAIRQGIITETTKACLEELETQRDSLKASILQLQLERHKFTKEEIVDWISKYKYGNIDDPDYRKEIIDTFVNSVFVYDDKLVLTYNYKDESETLTLQEIEAALSSNLDGMCPPLGYYTNLFTSTAALPLRSGSSDTDRKTDVLEAESVRFRYSCVCQVAGGFHLHSFMISTERRQAALLKAVKV